MTYISEAVYISGGHARRLSTYSSVVTDEPLAGSSGAELPVAWIIGFALIFMAVAGAGVATAWYRGTYWTWPGLGASDRVHWCGRDYDLLVGPPESWRQVKADAGEPWPIHPVDAYPPLGFSREQLLASTGPARARRPAGTPVTSCATLLYVRTDSGRYQTYSLLGGP
jgi:hypothetical protein